MHAHLDRNAPDIDLAAQEREVSSFNRNEIDLLEQQQQKQKVVAMDGAEGFNDLQGLPGGFAEYDISFPRTNVAHFNTDQDKVNQGQPTPSTSSPSYYLPLELNRPDGGFNGSIPAAAGSRLAHASSQHGTQLYHHGTSHRSPINIPYPGNQVVDISNPHSAIQDPSTYNEFVIQGSSTGGFVDDSMAFGSVTTPGLTAHTYPPPINGQLFMNTMQGFMGPARPSEYGFGGQLSAGSAMSTQLPQQPVYPAFPWSSTPKPGSYYTYPPPEIAQECPPAYGPGEIGTYRKMASQGRVQNISQDQFGNSPALSGLPWNAYVQQSGAAKTGPSKQKLANGEEAHTRTLGRATGKRRTRVISGTDDDSDNRGRAGMVDEADEPVDDNNYDSTMASRKTAPSTVDNSRDGRKESHMTREPSKVYTKPLTPATSWNHINVRHKYNYFTYTDRGVLDPAMFFGAVELKCYIDHCPRKPRMWVQHVPAQCNIRQGRDLQKCRFSQCPANQNNMPVGFDRVVFDEFWKETSSGQRDPFLVAFSMHLWCLEQCRDVLEDHLSGRLKPETRTFPKEDRNKMDLSRDSDKQIIPLTYDPWFGSRNFVTKPRKHKYTLTYALNQHHVRNQNRTRQKTRDKRNDKKEVKQRKTLDIHKGHLLYHNKKEPLTDATMEARYMQRIETIGEFQPKQGAQPNPEEEVDLSIEPEQEVNVELDGPDPPLIPRILSKITSSSARKDEARVKDCHQAQTKGGVEDGNAEQGDEGVKDCKGPQNTDGPEDNDDADPILVTVASNSNKVTGTQEKQAQLKDSGDMPDHSIQYIMTPQPSPSPRSTGSDGGQCRTRAPADPGHIRASPSRKGEDGKIHEAINTSVSTPRLAKRARDRSPKTPDEGRAPRRQKKAGEDGAQLVCQRRSPRQQQG
jgi:hypothetical protein